MGINTEEKRNHTAVRLGRGLPPHRATRLGISPGIDPVETDTFRAVGCAGLRECRRSGPTPFDFGGSESDRTSIDQAIIR
jgi:hypothetical protein